MLGVYILLAVSFHRIVEIREGQQFDKFPFEKVDGQSFSLMFEEESKLVNITLHNVTDTTAHTIELVN